ncbi:hypothetical protein [Fodinicola acaciae]|uniref:hypothetical protein n=1 Tax=Fodinicola acaciae TaxID=2681555 RepID=UPI0013D122E4|nr:hypothetical protein [Fodinicola acaciae]
MITEVSSLEEQLVDAAVRVHAAHLWLEIATDTEAAEACRELHAAEQAYIDLRLALS